ncbi:MAG TPA: patatin-like phospholipase family protein [Gemmatimonadaceae bacterium]|nr:patatin-like phospholipase family protein [Gemmatimonadaceae bacterium]
MKREAGRGRREAGSGTVALVIASMSLACASVKPALTNPAHRCEYSRIANCEHYPRTPVLSAPSAAGYRFANAPPTEHNSDELFVVLMLSGGGTRSAAFSFGVMNELGRTAVPRADRTLLDEVDLISSVSGGSFPAAYLALNGPQGLPKFETDFLKWNAQRDLTLTLLLNQGVRNRLRSQYFSRIDVAVEKWDQHLFHGATFGQLIGRRPYLMIDATDVATGTVFPFTQAYVDPLCFDLSKFQVARAVGASGAFPPLLSPLTIENHGSRCNYVPPEWVTTSATDRWGNRERYRMANEVRSLTNVKTRPYVHLTDGGAGDNIGARNITRALSIDEAEIPLAEMVRSGKIQRLLLIVVNAQVVEENDIDITAHAPGVLRTFLGAVDAPLNNYSQLSIESLRRAVEDLEEKNSAAACSNGAAAGCLSMFYVVEVSFDQILDSNDRQYFEHLPTTYSLGRRRVDALVKLGGRLLRANPEYVRLMCDLERGDWKKRSALAGCRDQAYQGLRPSNP